MSEDNISKKHQNELNELSKRMRIEECSKHRTTFQKEISGLEKIIEMQYSDPVNYKGEYKPTRFEKWQTKQMNKDYLLHKEWAVLQINGLKEVLQELMDLAESIIIGRIPDREEFNKYIRKITELKKKLHSNKKTEPSFETKGYISLKLSRKVDLNRLHSGVHRITQNHEIIKRWNEITWKDIAEELLKSDGSWDKRQEFYHKYDITKHNDSGGDSKKCKIKVDDSTCQSCGAIGEEGCNFDEKLPEPEKDFGFQLVEKFIPPRNIKCTDCINNPVPELIEGFIRKISELYFQDNKLLFMDTKQEYEEMLKK